MSEKKSTNIYDMAQVKLSKTGTKYIEITKDVTLPKGSRLFLKDMITSIEEKVSRGIIDEVKGEELISKYSKGGSQEFVLQTITATID